MTSFAIIIFSPHHLLSPSPAPPISFLYPFFAEGGFSSRKRRRDV
jgi:hypothetical protein